MNSIAVKIKSELLSILSVIPTPDTWCKGCNARDADGRKVGVSDPSAVAFCLYGAACKALGMEGEGRCASRLWRDYLTDFLGVDPIIFNDDPDTTHADLIARITEAIRKLDEGAMAS